MFELSTERQGSLGEVTALVARQLTVRQQALETERRARLIQDKEHRHALEQRRLSIQAETNQLEQEIALAQRRRVMAQASMEKYQTLQKNGFMSEAQVQQKQEELLDLAARLSTLQRNKLQLRATEEALASERAELAGSLATELAQLERASATLEQETVENRSRKTNVIVAPESGTITTITYEPGQSLLSGQVLATLLPHAQGRASELEVHLYAPSRTIGFVRTGQAVRIRLQAFPYEKYGIQDGVVTDISKTPFAPAELPTNVASTILAAGAQNGAEGLYRIMVKLRQQTVYAHAEQHTLRPGMTLEADIVQDRRKIWEWVAEPLFAVAHR